MVLNANFGGGNRNLLPKTPIPSTGTRRVSAKAVKDNSPETKAAFAFFNTLNTLTFDSGKFALALSRADPVIQLRVIDLLLSVIDLNAFRYDEGYCTNAEDYEAGIRAKRIQDSLQVYRDSGML